MGLPCWAVFALVAVVAWPVWHGAAEAALLRRRVMLQGVLVDQSRMRRWLWRGRLTRVLLVFSALAWTLLLVAAAVRFGWRDWSVAAADAALLWLLVGPIRRRVAREVRFEHVDAVTRRWPLAWANLVLLAIAFFALDFFVGAPDTRGRTWNEVATLGWREADGVACALLAPIVGALATIERLGWHVAETLVPSLPNPGWRYAAWAVLLLQGGLVGYALTRLLLGVHALWHAARAPATAEAGLRTGFLYWVTLAIVALAGFALLRTAPLDPAVFRQGAVRAIAWANPCRARAEHTEPLARQVRADIASSRDGAIVAAERRLAERLDAVFAEAELGVDRYLDWYFSVLGEYQRLGKLAMGELDEMMVESLERHLFGEGMFGERLQKAAEAVAAEAAREMAAVASRAGSAVEARVRQEPCRFGSLDLAPIAGVNRDLARVSASMGAGALVGGVAVRIAARQAVEAAAKRAAGKSTLQTASRLLGRNVVKRGGTIGLGATAAAACAPGGPLAIACGIGGLIAGWLVADKAFIAIDEMLFRDAMRAEILSSLREQRASLEAGMRAEQARAILQMAGAIEQSLDRVFVPARDGV